MRIRGETREATHARSLPGHKAILTALAAQ
jgi:hypothetical protein